jgi:hypothetical protein
MADSDFYADQVKFNEAITEFADLKKTLEKQETLWMDASEKIADIESRLT